MSEQSQMYSPSPRGHADAHKPFRVICIKFVVGHSHFGTVNGAERGENGFAFTALAKLLFELAVPLDGVVGEVGQMVFDLLNFHPPCWQCAGPPCRSQTWKSA